MTFSSFACSNLLRDRFIYLFQKYSITVTCYLTESSRQQQKKRNEAERWNPLPRITQPKCNGAGLLSQPSLMLFRDNTLNPLGVKETAALPMESPFPLSLCFFYPPAVKPLTVHQTYPILSFTFYSHSKMFSPLLFTNYIPLFPLNLVNLCLSFEFFQ